MRRVLFLAVVFSGFLVAQGYRLQTNAVSGGGNVHLHSSGYRCGLSAGQTVASGLLASTGYMAVLGFWCRPYVLGGVGEEGELQQPRADFALSRCHPNPFSNRAVLSYVLPSQSDVRLSVVDKAGRVVGRLVHARQSAGKYRLNWDISSTQKRELPAGVYILKLEAGGQVAVRSIVIAR